MKYDIEQAIAILSRTPKVLRAMLEGLGDEWLHGNTGDKTFSPFDVVGHLIHGERTDWIPRARIILEHGEAQAFEPFDRFAQWKENKGKTIDELLDTFEQLRAQRIDDQRALQLDADKLALRGTHPALGTVTMENLLATWVAHDLNHIAQIARAMAHQYRDRVGPWGEYLGILPPQRRSAHRWLNYLRCQDCNYICQIDVASPLYGSHVPCPCCGTSGESQFREHWPDIGQDIFDESLSAVDYSSDEAVRVAVLFLAFNIEYLFDRFIKELVYSRSDDNAISATLLRDYSGFERGRRLFKRLVGTPMKEALSSLGHVGVYDDWEIIYGSRSLVAHESPAAVSATKLFRKTKSGKIEEVEASPRELIQRTTESILTAFMNLNNRFVACH